MLNSTGIKFKGNIKIVYVSDDLISTYTTDDLIAKYKHLDLAGNIIKNPNSNIIVYSKKIITE